MSKRQRWDMPDDVQTAITGAGLGAAYQNRPPYQQNDYIGWIEQAKQPETRQRRLQQMVDELKAGDVYMKMPWGGQLPSISNKVTEKPQSIAEYIAGSSELFADVIRALDNCLRSINPNYSTKAAWGGWAYMDGDNFSCLSVRYKNHVKLMVYRGAMLEDPKKLLKGTGINTRHMRFESQDDIDCKYLKKLLTKQKELYNSGVSWKGTNGV